MLAHIKNEAVAYIIIGIGLCCWIGKCISENWTTITAFNPTKDMIGTGVVICYLMIGFIAVVLVVSFAKNANGDPLIETHREDSGGVLCMMILVWPMIAGIAGVYLFGKLFCYLSTKE